MAPHLRIGTRGSRLALWQAEQVRAMLLSHATAELVIIETAGDQVRDVPLSAFGGQGAFTKEIQRALLDNRADVAVHSLKDLPTIPVEGLILAAVPARGPTGDALVTQKYASFDRLPNRAVVATSSLRRRAQLLHRRPDLEVVNIRGNVETRLRKLKDENLDALVLAQAGLERLGFQDQITDILDPHWMLPAVGQGALGLECRADDPAALELLRRLNHEPSHLAVLAERAFLRALQGGCQVPIGAAAQLDGDRLTLRAVVLDPNGKHRIAGQHTGPAAAAEALGHQLATDLLAQGAQALLNA